MCLPACECEGLYLREGDVHNNAQSLLHLKTRKDWDKNQDKNTNDGSLSEKYKNTTHKT